MSELTRRRFLAGSAVVTAGALAGCAGNGGDGGDGGDGGGATPTATETPSSTASSPSSPTASATSSPTSTGGGGSQYPEVDQWLSGTSNYDGVTDETGSSEVTVKVGAEGNGGNFAFAPAAVKVSSGTTVVWEWTGKGGAHNVVSSSDSAFSFDSGDPVQSGTFEHTFDGSGVGLYLCEPHVSLGMKGAVVVE